MAEMVMFLTAVRGRSMTWLPVSSMVPLAVAAVAETEAQFGSMNVAMIEDPPGGNDAAAAVGVVAVMISGPPFSPGARQL